MNAGDLGMKAGAMGMMQGSQAMQGPGLGPAIGPGMDPGIGFGMGPMMPPPRGPDYRFMPPVRPIRPPMVGYPRMPFYGGYRG